MKLSREFFDVFRSETDRAAAVLGAELVNAKLKAYLEVVVVNPKKDLFGHSGIAGDFASRTEILYQFNLLPKYEYLECTSIRKVRNKFAHSIDHEMDFSQLEIVDLVNSLNWPKVIVNVEKFPDNLLLDRNDLAAVQNSSRRKYEVSVGAMVWILERRLANHEPTKAINDELQQMCRLAGVG